MKKVTWMAVLAALLTNVPPAVSQGRRAPNVVLVVTDDQGYGDLGAHGNPRISTPNLDRLARDSVRFRSFYVSPVCSPTRASLLTGRYNYRTGVVDTYLGRSLMRADEVTLAEMVRAGNYRTGIFGKWHLGDNYPMRAMDQGFDESLVLNGGGIGQPSDPPDGESYFDPVLRRNGEWVKTRGYVSDVITDAAIAFIDANRSRPFFAYVAFNAPHTPLQVPERYYQKYRQAHLEVQQFPSTGHPIPTGFDADTTAKVYGMVENIDDNVGRLLTSLDRLDLASETIVIFLTDNGPQQPRYNAGMFERKGTTYEGGIRVPFYLRWPGHFAPGREVDRVAAHVDVTPTLLDLCGVRRPDGVVLDGTSLRPLLEASAAPWPDRTLFFQWHRGDVPEKYRAFAARSQRYKLVQPAGAGDATGGWVPAFKLYDMSADPLEERDLAGARPDVVASMKAEYDAWFEDVTRGLPRPRIAIGAPEENPVRLTRQDWRGPRAGWTPSSLGHWDVDVVRAGEYHVTVRIAPRDRAGTLSLSLGGSKGQKPVEPGAASVVFENVRLSEGEGVLQSEWSDGGTTVGVLDVVVRHLR